MGFGNMLIPYIAPVFQPDAIVQEFALTLAHGLALLIIASMMPPRPRRKP
jgi:hypothetical protein